MKDKFYFPIVKYLSFFAKFVLKNSHSQVITVTGSSGKSSMFELIKLVLKEAKLDLKAAEHSNSAIGIPLNILELESTDVNNTKEKVLRWIKIIFLSPFISVSSIFDKSKRHAFYLFEQDSDRPHEMGHSAWLLHADAVIWLNSGITHSVYHDISVEKGSFENIEESIAYDFSQSVKRMKKQGLAILNTDEKMVNKYKKSSRGNVVEIGKDAKCIKLRNYELHGLQSIFDIEIDKEALLKELWMYNFNQETIKSWDEHIHIEINGYLLPEHYYYIFASAIIFSIYMKIPFGTFMSALTKYKLPPGRMSVFEGINGTYIIDSSYNNGNAKALIDALDLLSEFQNTTAIIGDMRELGNEAKEEHEKIARKILETNINKVLLVGPSMSTYTYNYLVNNKFDNKRVYTYETTKALKDDLIKNSFTQVEKDSIVLIKGSQNTIFLESIVELLLKDKRESEYLCRRGKVWDERRIACGL